MTYAVYQDYPEVIDAQQAERLHQQFWPTVRLGTFGEVAAPTASQACPRCSLRRPHYRIGQPGPFGADDAPLEAPLGVLANGSIILLPAGAVVIGPGGDVNADALGLQQPTQFKIGKSVDVKLVGQSDPGWVPQSTNVAFDKYVAAVAVDPVVAEPLVSPGSSFEAAPGMHATIPLSAVFSIVVAERGSDARFAALSALPGTGRAAVSRVGMIVAVASAIAVVGLFAATLTLGKEKR